MVLNSSITYWILLQSSPLDGYTCGPVNQERGYLLESWIIRIVPHQINPKRIVYFKMKVGFLPINLKFWVQEISQPIFEFLF